MAVARYGSPVGHPGRWRRRALGNQTAVRDFGQSSWYTGTLNKANEWGGLWDRWGQNGRDMRLERQDSHDGVHREGHRLWPNRRPCTCP